MPKASKMLFIVALALTLSGCTPKDDGNTLNTPDVEKTKEEKISLGPTVEMPAANSVSIPSDIKTLGSPPIYPILQVKKAPVIDGKLDDSCWETIPRMGQMYLDNGNGPMKFDTIAKLARDDTHLYFAVESMHPDVSQVVVRKGTRDSVSWAGETVELFLDTDPMAKKYVQVIFDMSGAFTDTYAGDTKWNGDITAATDICKTGWKLEAKLKISDLGGKDNIDKFLWSGNVARSTRGQSGSWARINGSYQQPGLFGLLTLANECVVEDIGLGVFAPPAKSADKTVVRLSLQDTTTPVNIKLETLEPATGKPVQELMTPDKSGKIKLMQMLSIGKATKAKITITPENATTPVFSATLPIRRLATPGDCLISKELTCAIRPLVPVALRKDEIEVYLMAQSFLNKKVDYSGKLVLRAENLKKNIWSCPVKMQTHPSGSVEQLVKLPADKMENGQYTISWIPDDSTETSIVTKLDYYPDLRKWLKDLLVSPLAKDVLAKMDCPTPEDIRDSALVQVKIDRLVKYLAEEDNNIEIDLAPAILRNCRQLTDLVSTLKDKGKYTADQRGWFEIAIFSPVDDSAQPYSLFVPYDYDKDTERQYPLVIKLHGAGGTHNGEAGFAPGTGLDITDRLILRPLGRGKSCGYYALSGNDVLNEILDVKTNYRIDPDAVHLTGGSMGGFGSFTIGSINPDLFATCTPLCGGGWEMPLEQMNNLPTFIHHGLADGVVRPWCSLFSATVMEHYRHPVQLYLHPAVGHSVGGVAGKITNWETLKTIRRDPEPRTVVLTGDIPAKKHAYWLSIVQYADPHKDAFIEATFTGKNHLNFISRNVAWAKISLPGKWIDKDKPLQITTKTGRQWTEVIPDSAKFLYVQLNKKELKITAKTPGGVENPKAYLGGGVRRLFMEGRALRIVYGTKGTKEQTESLKKLADALHKKNFYGWRAIEVGGLPVLKDTEVTDDIQASCDLILLGTEQENQLIAKMAKQLPVKLADGKIVVETKPAMQWPEKAVVFSLFYRNPLAPARRIWWFYGVNEIKSFLKLSGVTEHGHYGQFIPDLIVQSGKEQNIIATAKIIGDWELSRDGKVQAKELWKTPGELEKTFSDLLLASVPADINLVGLLSNYDILDWENLTDQEVLNFIPKRSLMIIPVTGKELLDWRKEIAEKEKSKTFNNPWVGIPADKLKPEAMYQVLVPGWGPTSGLERPGASFRKGKFISSWDFEDVKERFQQNIDKK